MENKYTKEALEYGIGTTNGWGYDLFEGGYIRPNDILTDSERANKLQSAIDILYDWKKELEDDGIMNEL